MTIKLTKLNCLENTSNVCRKYGKGTVFFNIMFDVAHNTTSDRLRGKEDLAHLMAFEC